MRIRLYLPRQYFSKHFNICLLLSLIIAIACLLAGSFMGAAVSHDEAMEWHEAVEQQRADFLNASVSDVPIGWLQIYANNMGITLLSVIPFWGMAFVPRVDYNTGYWFGTLSKSIGMNNLVYMGFVLSTPVGVLEYFAYIFVYAEGLMLTYGLLKGKWKERLKGESWKTLLFAGALLLAAALIEWAWFL